MADSPVVNGASPLAGVGALLDEKQREIRVAEQAAHAERMRRIELQEQLARRRREQTEADVLRVDLAAARERIREMNRERERLCREVAEAEQRVAVLVSRAPSSWDEARARAGLDDPARGLLVAERALAATRSSPRTLAKQPEAVTAMEAAQALRAAEFAPAPTAAGSAQATTAAESAPAVAASEREPTIAPIEAGRLEAALSRLREAVPEPAEGTAVAEPAPAGAVWIESVFRAMVRRDPAGAGRLTVALLPAQPLVQPLPLAYDLVLSDLGCVQVTAAGGRAVVELRDAARRRDEVQLVVHGGLSSLARLIAAGPVRRRLLRRGLARARGSRSTLKALRSLVRAPLGLEQLRAAGVRPSPAVSLSLIAAMVQPDWTKGETFTIAHREPEARAAGGCLRVRDGAPVVAGDPGEARLGGGAHVVWPTTIVCPSTSLLAVFDGAGGPETSVEGDGRPLAVVQSWVKRAQSV